MSRRFFLYDKNIFFAEGVRSVLTILPCMKVTARSQGSTISLN